MADASRVTLPAVLDRFVAYHRANPAWGSLHIVLEDGNVTDADVAWCARYAAGRGDAAGADLAAVLGRMSRTQRLKLPHRVRAAEARRLLPGGPVTFTPRETALIELGLLAVYNALVRRDGINWPADGVGRPPTAEEVRDLLRRLTYPPPPPPPPPPEVP